MTILKNLSPTAEIIAWLTGNIGANLLITEGLNLTIKKKTSTNLSYDSYDKTSREGNETRSTNNHVLSFLRVLLHSSRTPRTDLTSVAIKASVSSLKHGDGIQDKKYGIISTWCKHILYLQHTYHGCTTLSRATKGKVTHHPHPRPENKGRES